MAYSHVTGNLKELSMLLAFKFYEVKIVNAGGRSDSLPKEECRGRDSKRKNVWSAEVQLTNGDGGSPWTWEECIANYLRKLY